MKIKFINHACFTVEVNDNLLMFDPWFEGKVFNNSWSLIKETNINDIKIKKLKVILISHEHPDHLHWNTLKNIKSKTEQKILVIIPKRNNDNVKKAIQKLGFVVMEIPPNKSLHLFDDFTISNYPTGHDSAYVLKHKNQVLLNQNDCKLSQNQCNIIKQAYPKIDYYFMQFSLAGYYANKSEHLELEAAKKEHKDMIERYRTFFNPTTTIPFASFVYFCRQENQFLNNYIVGLEEVNIDSSYQMVTYMDDVLLSGFLERNDVNIRKWKENIKNLKIYQTETIPKEEILENISIFLKSINNSVCPEKSRFKFYDIEESLHIDYNNKKAYFALDDKQSVAKTTTYDMNCFFKFPWGADTMNITSCFEVYDKEKWRQNLIFKDSFYKR